MSAAVRSRFFAHTALAMLALTLLSFPITYFGPIATGAADRRPPLHPHGVAVFAGTPLNAQQTHLLTTTPPARPHESA